MSREVVEIPPNGSFCGLDATFLITMFLGVAFVAFWALLVIKELRLNNIGASMWHFGAFCGKRY